MKTFNTLILVSALATLAGCQQKEQSAEDERNVTGAEVKEELKEAAETTGEYLAESKDAVVAAARQQLQSMDSKIDALASKSANYTDQAKTEADAALAKLREQRAAAAQKLDELKTAGQETWKDVKSGFDQAWNRLQETYEETKSRFTD